MEKPSSVKCDPNQGLDPVLGTDPESGSAVSYVPLKSIQAYQTQDEFLVAMREDLAEWFNALYDLTLQETTLLAHLSTGVLLCQHANAFNDAMKCSSSGKDSIRALDVPSISDSSCSFESGSTVSGSPVSGSGNGVPCNKGARPGNFHSRVNISNFLSWCRGTLGLRDTLLFETEDLVQDRNERNIVLCLLEVARRGARIGMLAPNLVQLEVEIDEEIRRDAVSNGANNDIMDGHHGCPDRHGNSGALGGSGGEGTRDVGVQTADDAERTGDGMVQTFLKCSLESICSSESSFKHHRTPVKGHPVPPHPPRVPISHPSQGASATPGRPIRTRPVIEVDMMSLDEMVRKTLNRCTCEFQYPMVRVSEGKYRIGESLTFIFVRILRNHVMVRIGGGWDTLENYLNRHDPCRMEAKASKAGTRRCTHISNASSTSSVIANSTSDQSADQSRQEEGGGGGGEDAADRITSGGTFQQDESERSPDNSTSHRHLRGLAGQTDDLVSVQSTDSNLGGDAPLLSPGDDDIANSSTRVTPSGKTVVDVACQTDTQELTRRYSSSSGASSLEPTNERFEVNNNRTQEQQHQQPSSDNTGKCVSNDVDTISNSAEENQDNRNTATIQKDPGVFSSLSTKNLKQKSCQADSTRVKSSRALPSICSRCGHPMSDKLNKGLCSTCFKQGTDCRPSAQDNRYRKERPGSAQDKRRLPERPGSSQDKRCRGERPGSAQEKRHRADRPESAQNSISRVLPVALGQDQTLGVTCRTMTGSRKEVTTALSQVQRQLKQRPVSAQEKRPSNARLLPSTKQSQRTNRAPTPELPGLLVSSKQRPSSAREQGRHGAALRTMNDPNDERSRGTISQIGTPEKQLESGHAKHSNTPQKNSGSVEDLVEGEEGDSGQVRRRTAILRRRSMNTHAAKLPLVRELSDANNSDVSQHTYHPETTELSDTSQLVNEEMDSTVKTRPRKDIQRRGSLTKIPKPFGLI